MNRKSFGLAKVISQRQAQAQADKPRPSGKPQEQTTDLPLFAERGR